MPPITPRTSPSLLLNPTPPPLYHNLDCLTDSQTPMLPPWHAWCCPGLQVDQEDPGTGCTKLEARHNVQFSLHFVILNLCRVLAARSVRACTLTTIALHASSHSASRRPSSTVRSILAAWRCSLPRTCHAAQAKPPVNSRSMGSRSAPRARDERPSCRIRKSTMFEPDISCCWAAVSGRDRLCPSQHAPDKGPKCRRKPGDTRWMPIARSGS